MLKIYRLKSSINRIARSITPLKAYLFIVDTSDMAYDSSMVLASNPLLSRLERRRVELGMSCASVARLTGLGLRTVQRVLCENDSNATLATILKISDVLGVGLDLVTRDLNEVRARRAQYKAQKLVGVVQATMGLEASALDEKAMNELVQQTVRDLLRGSNRKLWDD